MITWDKVRDSVEGLKVQTFSYEEIRELSHEMWLHLGLPQTEEAAKLRERLEYVQTLQIINFDLYDKVVLIEAVHQNFQTLARVKGEESDLFLGLEDEFLLSAMEAECLYVERQNPVDELKSFSIQKILTYMLQLEARRGKGGSGTVERFASTVGYDWGVVNTPLPVLRRKINTLKVAKSNGTFLEEDSSESLEELKVPDLGHSWVFGESEKRIDKDTLVSYIGKLLMDLGEGKDERMSLDNFQEKLKALGY